MQCSEAHIPSKEANLTLLIERNIDFTVRESSIIQENKIKVEKHYIGGHVNKPCIDKKSTSQGLRHQAGVAVAGGVDS